MINDLSASLSLLIKAPARDIQGVMRHERNRISKRYKRKRSRLLTLPLSIATSLLSVLSKILLSPFELWAAIFKKKKRSRLLLFVMVPCCCLLLGWVGYSWPGLQSRQTISLLRSQATAAIEQNKFEEAVGCFEQLELVEATLSHEEKFRWAKALSHTNQSEQASDLLNELAPGQGQSTGYAPAHQLAAVSLVRTYKQPYPAKIKQLLNWHLNAGGESESPDVSFARAQYYISIAQPQPAIDAMKIAAQAKPELNLNLALLYKQVDKTKNEQAALSIAQTTFESRLQANPKDHQARIGLAQTYLRQRNPKLAQQRLQAGVELAPEVFRRQLSDFFMQKFHNLPDTASVELKVNTLINAWQNNWQNITTCQDMVRLYRQQTGADQEFVLMAIEQSANEQPLAALPQFALGIIYRIENRLPESKASIESAHQLLDPDQPGFTVVANNLAWLLAHDQQPDLEQAFKLAEIAVRHSPDEGGLRDTLATVLMKQGRHQQALAEFQKALLTIQNKSPIHLKMATIYDEIGQPQLAILHRKQSQPE